MIISASYRTDIPALYGDWFMARLRAGACTVVNPYTGRRSTLPLSRPPVRGIVFWTRNVGPFLDHLEEVRARGYPFVVQHTVTGLPRVLEPAVPDPSRVAEHAAGIRASHGPHALVWRYDPVVFTSLSPASSHVETFGRLARSLRGLTDEVVVSFAQPYAKTRRRMDEAARREGFTWWDPPEEEKRDLVGRLVGVAADHGMALKVCAQAHLVVEGAGEARCVDAGRLSRVAGMLVPGVTGGHRKGCGCHASRDVGDYDTCTQGCLYCYAVRSPALARERFRVHDPGGVSLVPAPCGAVGTPGPGETLHLPLGEGGAPARDR